jgi:hypothetical protein
MKIKTAFIIFAILILSFICLRSGTATTRQLPLSDKQISSANAVPFRFLSCFGASDADHDNSLALDKAGNVYLAGTTWSNGSGRSTIDKKCDKRILEVAVTGEVRVFKAASAKAPQNREIIHLYNQCWYPPQPRKSSTPIFLSYIFLF